MLRTAHLFVLALAGCLAAAAQQTALRADTDLVEVPVAVTDWNERPVTGLDSSLFHVFDDKVEQPLAYFSSEDVPLTLGIVLDASGSMSGKMAKAREAVARVLDTANPGDEFFLVTFSHSVELTVPFTTNASSIRDAASAAAADGRTALLDGICEGLHYIKGAHNERRALLVISDGGENHSRYRRGEIRDLLRESGVWVYAIGIYEPEKPWASEEEKRGPSLLSNLTDESGGRELETTDADDLPKLAETISRELRSVYVLGYRAPERHDGGKYRRIEVKVKRHGVHASWKPGYYSPTD